MNTDPNLEEYPRLVAPDVVYMNKASLKKPAVIPLYAKVLSAAAAVALLFVFLWKPVRMPQQELTAAMNPIGGVRIETDETLALKDSQAHFNFPKKTSPVVVTKTVPVTMKRTETTLLAQLPPQEPVMLPTRNQGSELLILDNPYEDALASLTLEEEENGYYDNGREMSFLRRSFLKITDGQYESFGKMLQSGWRSAKGEIAQLNDAVSDGLTSVKSRDRYLDRFKER